MGADIHMFAEFKAGDGPWTAHPLHQSDEEGRVDSIGGDRNYEVFGALAGVRGDGPEPRGLPNDVTEIVLKASNQWGGDAHSHSYYSLAEFKNIIKNTRNTNYSKSTFDAINEHKKKLELDLKSEKILLGQNINTKVEVRIVFFFDN
jgi:hypothetical protein